MDTITHILAGAVIGGAAKEKLGWAGPVAAVAGSFVPDADLFFELMRAESLLKYHRVVTNSFLGIAVIPILTALAVWLAFGKKTGFKAIWFLVFLGYVFHVFMDYTNSYGNVPFWPFSNRWYAFDLVFIVDPWVTGILAASLLLMLLRVRAMPVAAVCFALLFSYWGLRYYTHSGAVRDAREQVPDALKVGAFPAALNPFKWRVVAETEDTFIMGEYEAGDGLFKDRRVYRKPDPVRAVSVAANAPNAKYFLQFARFPLTSYERLADGWMVRFQDLRFSSRPGDNRFVATVKVGDDGRVLSDGFKF
jgi:inner membrane protein